MHPDKEELPLPPPDGRGQFACKAAYRTEGQGDFHAALPVFPAEYAGRKGKHTMDENNIHHTGMDNELSAFTRREPLSEFPPLPESEQKGIRLDETADAGIPGNSSEGAFYADPSAAPESAPRPERTAVPPPVRQKVSMTRRVYTMSAVTMAIVFMLSIYCIMADIFKGALNADEVPKVSKVVIQMQKTPKLDPEDENVTAEGTYTVAGVAEKVSPSIVQISVYDDKACETMTGSGSGIILSDEGYILTNAHVVQGAAFKVTLYDERIFDAKLVGNDNKTDLAVIRIEANDLAPAVFADSDEAYVGQPVVAIGNPAGLKSTVTQGIVSGINRQMQSSSNSFKTEYIQTDTAISPGNSGGALVNMYGQVIGITSLKYASGVSTVYEGLGFAISSNYAMPIVRDLMENGYVSGRFRVGIVFSTTESDTVREEFAKECGTALPKSVKGLWISQISEECDISNTELRVFDIITTINGTAVVNYEQVMDALEGFQGGDYVKADCVRVEKNGTIHEFEIEFRLEPDTSGNY